MKKYIVLGIVLTLVLTAFVGLTAFPTMANTTESYPLYAGQDELVGHVEVWNDADNLYVKYVLNNDAIDDGWCITETHLQVFTDDDPFTGIILKNGNPPPGKFDYIDEDIDCENEYQVPPIPLDPSWTNIFIAAHAVIEKEECELIAEAPYSAFSIVDYCQGPRKDGSPVREGRSEPGAVLTYDLGQDETNFFSLGFGGWIIVEFECCIPNEEGDDILVVEDTWGTYPLESADVYASQDSVTWVYLGEADNIARDPVYGYHTVSYFDLEDVGMDCAKFIKVVDTSDPAVHSAAADGYDLNVILALHDCYECTIYDETAWGAISVGQKPFPGSNWATYFAYDIQGWSLMETITVPAIGTKMTSTNSLEADHLYKFEASGTCNWRVPPSSNGYLGDAEYWLRNDAYGVGWTHMGIWSLAMWDGAPVEVEWGAYNAAHVYTVMYTPSADGAVTFFFNDDVYSDNSGSLTVNIYQWA